VRQLGPNVILTVRPSLRLFHLILEPHDGRALVPIPKRSASDIDTAVVDGLKVLDPNGRLEKLPRFRGMARQKLTHIGHWSRSNLFFEQAFTTLWRQCAINCGDCMNCGGIEHWHNAIFCRD
jgi:hypothetical protein